MSADGGLHGVGPVAVVVAEMADHTTCRWSHDNKEFGASARDLRAHWAHLKQELIQEKRDRKTLV